MRRPVTLLVARAIRLCTPSTTRAAIKKGGGLPKPWSSHRALRAKCASATRPGFWAAHLQNNSRCADHGAFDFAQGAAVHLPALGSPQHDGKYLAP